MIAALGWWLGLTVLGVLVLWVVYAIEGQIKARRALLRLVRAAKLRRQFARAQYAVYLARLRQRELRIDEYQRRASDEPHRGSKK